METSINSSGELQMHNITKTIKFIFIIFLTILTLHANDLNWENNYDKALKQAQKEKKLVYLFIGADHCKYCKKYKETTLSKKEVIERIKKDFIPLYMSRDQDLIPDKFEIYGVPRHYFLTAKGEIITNYQGIWDDTGLYSLLNEAISEKDNL
jgi:thiol-disulfide isomerase/thioredoxin